ncbi:MAG TPA: heme-binding domain-containing protein [Thermoanaerobaculia bacterium]|nr:heme-binding domain-containing protein [Thermoanaerobaculia bacterium]
MKKFFKVVFIVLIVVFIAGQAVRPDRTNPPIHPANVLQTPADVQAILNRSCMDCHSNATTWPWYTNISPVSWWIADHVREGRRELNFSEFNTYSAKKAAHKMEEVCGQLESGEMPLSGYAGPLHPDAHLSDADKARLCEWAKSERKRLKS